MNKFKESSKYQIIIDMYINWSDKETNKFSKIDFILKNMVKVFLVLTGRYVYFRQIEMVITTKCTLRCKECINFMQYYEHPYNMDLNELKNTFETLCSSVDEIGKFIVIGGEPFLYPCLGEWFQYIRNNKKVNIIEVFTNGTIVPKQEIVEMLKKNNIRVVISDYGLKSNNLKNIRKEFDNNGILYRVEGFETRGWWRMIGGSLKRNRTNQELKQQFRRCNTNCRSLLNNELHYCPRSSHGVDLGIVPRDSNDFINLADKNTNLKKKIRRMIYQKLSFITACDYCDLGTENVEIVDPGEQMVGTRKDNII